MQAIDDTDASVLPRSRKTQAVLALLALADAQPVNRRALTSLLWSGRDRPQAAGSLRQAVHELQLCLQRLGPDRLHADRTKLVLAPGGLWVDALEVARATPNRPEALDLFRRPLLEDLAGLDPAFDAWLMAERRRLGIAAAAVAASFLAAQSDPSDTIKAAERLLGIDPANEHGWRSLMAAHVARGERAAALETFERCCARLAEIAQTSPSPQTLALVERIRAAPMSLPGAPGSASDLQRSTPGPLLGVMPLRPIGGGHVESLSLGLAEEITTAFSRFGWVSCLSSATLASLSGEPSIDTERWRALGLDFLLDGTLQRSDQRVRINMRLLDMRAAGQVVWARRFDRDATDILALQDEIAAQTVAQLDPELLLREGRRVSARAITDPTAYELMLAAIPSIYLLDRSAFDQAGKMLACAVALDPNLASAHAWWAYWHQLQLGQGWAEDADVAVAKASELAERAIMLDPGDARALTLSGHVRSYLHKRPEEGKLLHERALAINPNLPMAWVFSGLAHAYLGQHEEAILRLRRARQLSPLDPHGFFFDMALAVPYMLRGEHTEAIALGRRAAEMNPVFSSTYKVLLVSLGHEGLNDEATLVRKRLLGIEPGFSVSEAMERLPFVSQQDRETYATGLRLAGLPE
jgi:DNA-binding SARP family transcriptional activator/TolB-like protein